MRDKGVEFYTQLNEESRIENGIRYFLLKTNRKNEKVIIKNKIEANIVSNLIMSFNDDRKVVKSYVLVTFFVVGILISLI